MKTLRIIFMGTPEFAVPSLEILLEHDYNIVAVITAPDKPQGRGRKTIPSPVKQCARKHNIPVLQPTNLKSPEFIAELKSINADLQVVVAFRMLPEIVWSMPPKGTFNLHASLLPKYRGAAPIHWAIINGEQVTGVTTFFLQHQIDTGNIVLQQSELIHDSDTTGTLADRLMQKGAELVLKTTELIEKDQYDLIPQDLASEQPKAPKLHKELCQIDWDKNSQEVVNFIRGLNPFPSAWTIVDGTTYKIHRAVVDDKVKMSADPGQYQTDNVSYLRFKTHNGVVSITEMQAPGKRRMTIEEFLRGNKL